MTGPARGREGLWVDLGAVQAGPDFTLTATRRLPPAPSSLVVRAFTLAQDAHRGQVDKVGRDYLLGHLTPVAQALRPYGDHAEAAGWLHDVLEDTPVTVADLVHRGFPDAVIDAVLACTRRDGETYPALIARAAAHPLGRLVKLADNWVNLTGLGTLARTDPATAARLRVKYEQARDVLTHALDRTA